MEANKIEPSRAAAINTSPVSAAIITPLIMKARSIEPSRATTINTISATIPSSVEVVSTEATIPLEQAQTSSQLSLRRNDHQGQLALNGDQLQWLLTHLDFMAQDKSITLSADVSAEIDQLLQMDLQGLSREQTYFIDLKQFSALSEMMAPALIKQNSSKGLAAPEALPPVALEPAQTTGAPQGSATPARSAQEPLVRIMAEPGTQTPKNVQIVEPETRLATVIQPAQKICKQINSEEASAAKIQALFRGHKGRTLAKEKKVEAARLAEEERQTKEAEARKQATAVMAAGTLAAAAAVSATVRKIDQSFWNKLAQDAKRGTQDTQLDKECFGAWIKKEEVDQDKFGIGELLVFMVAYINKRNNTSEFVSRVLRTKINGAPLTKDDIQRIQHIRLHDQLSWDARVVPIVELLLRLDFKAASEETIQKIINPAIPTLVLEEFKRFLTQEEKNDDKTNIYLQNFVYPLMTQISYPLPS